MTERSHSVPAPVALFVHFRDIGSPEQHFVEITRENILSTVATACSNGTLDGVACNGLDGRIRTRVASKVSVTIPDLQQDEAARSSLNDRFDRSFCY